MEAMTRFITSSIFINAKAKMRVTIEDVCLASQSSRSSFLFKKILSWIVTIERTTGSQKCRDEVLR